MQAISATGFTRIEAKRDEKCRRQRSLPPKKQVAALIKSQDKVLEEDELGKAVEPAIGDDLIAVKSVALGRIEGGIVLDPNLATLDINDAKFSQLKGVKHSPAYPVVVGARN